MRLKFSCNNDNYTGVSIDSNLVIEGEYASLQLSLFPAEILPPNDDCRPVIEPDRRREDLVVLLREANEHLIRATLSARDLQIKAEVAKKKQDEFLAMMAHELRNPLAPIATAADVLKLIPNLSAPIKKVQQTIARQTKHLAYLIDHLLDGARLNSGNIRIESELIDFVEIIQCAVETSQPVIDQKQQQLQLVLPCASIFLRGDPVRLTQVFTNLFVNASKFSDEEACIWLTVHATACEITASVRDEGIGITSEFLPRVFEIFSQAPQGLARTKGGLGIGLALVRSILAMHGGSVHAYSAGTGCGSEFIVRLPRALQD